MKFATALLFTFLFATLTHATELPPGPQCLTTLPAKLKEMVGSYQVVQRSDLLMDLQNSPKEFQKLFPCSAYQAYLNVDSNPDYALLLLDPQTGGLRFQIIVTEKDGSLKSVLSKDYPSLAAAKVTERVYTTIRVKKPGEVGSGSSNVSPLSAAEQQSYEAGYAVEICDPAKRKANGLPEHLTFAALCQCGIGYFFSDGTLKTVRACDQ